MKKILGHLTLSAAALGFSNTAYADAAEAACKGSSVDPSLRGKYNADENTTLEIGGNSIKGPDGTSIKSWSCEKNGVLILVLDFEGKGERASDAYESRAVAVSGQHLLLIGEVEGTKLNPFSREFSANLNAEGIQVQMKAGLVEIWKKNKTK